MSFADPQRQHPALSFKSDPLCPVTVAQWYSEDSGASWTTPEFFFFNGDLFHYHTIRGGDMFLHLIHLCVYWFVSSFSQNGVYCIQQCRTLSVANIPQALPLSLFVITASCYLAQTPFSVKFHAWHARKQVCNSHPVKFHMTATGAAK